MNTWINTRNQHRQRLNPSTDLLAVLYLSQSSSQQAVGFHPQIWRCIGSIIIQYLMPVGASRCCVCVLQGCVGVACQGYCAQRHAHVQCGESNVIDSRSHLEASREDEGMIKDDEGTLLRGPTALPELPRSRLAERSVRVPLLPHAGSSQSTRLDGN